MYKSISDELSWWCPGLCAVWDLPPKAGRGWMDNCHYHCKSCISLISIAFLVRFDSLHSHRLCRPHHRHSMLLSGATFLYWCDDHSHFSQAVWCDLEVSLISQHVFCLKTYHQIIRKFTSWWLNRCQNFKSARLVFRMYKRAWKRECSLIWVGQLTMADHQFHTVQNYSNSALMMLYQPAQDFPLFEGSMCSTQNINKTFNSQHESTKSINPLPGCILYFDANWLYEPLQGQRIVLCNHICGDHLDLRPRSKRARLQDCHYQLVLKSLLRDSWKNCNCATV